MFIEENASQLYAQAIKLWGREFIFNKCIEELGEFIAELSRANRDPWNIDTKIFIGELVDASVMIENVFEVLSPENRVLYHEKKGGVPGKSKADD